MESTMMGVILGSTLLSAIVSALFSHITNNRSNTMQHITVEREKWREKIRTISEGIQKSEYNNIDDKNIKPYLVQLEVNINPYGKDTECDFQKDAHIWTEIENIQQVKSEEDFNKHKELLIYYLSLMLKEDWERSKQEVRGYSRTITELFVILFVNCSIELYYAYKLKSDAKDWIDIIALTIIVTIIIYVVLRYIEWILVGKTVKNNRFRSIYYLETFFAFIIYTSIMYIILSLLNIITNEFCNELREINLIAYCAVFFECYYIYFNWMKNSLKNAALAQQVISIRQKALDENKHNIERYKSEIETVYGYIKQNQQKLDEIKPSIVLLKRIIKEYKIELRMKKRNMRIDAVGARMGEECNKIQTELKKMDDLLNSLTQFSTEGIINRIIRGVKELHPIQKGKKLIYKAIRLFWNKPGNSSLM